MPKETPCSCLSHKDAMRMYASLQTRMACVVWERVRFLFMVPNSYPTADTGLGIAHRKGKSTAECGLAVCTGGRDCSAFVPHAPLATSIKTCSNWDGWSMCALGFLSHISLERAQEHQLTTTYTGPPSPELKELLLSKLSPMEPGIPTFSYA